MSTALRPSALSSLLTRAEGLLAQVSLAVPSASQQPVRQSDKQERAHTRDASALSSQVDLLLGGLDDAYGDVEIEDEAVDRILREGGAPPSQIRYQSLYALSQTVLAKVSAVRYLNLSIHGMCVYSADAGIRRDCSFISVSPPTGCAPNFHNTEKIVLRSAEKDRPGRGRGGRTESGFLVGGVAVDATMSWAIELTDETIAAWHRDESKASVVLSLHSSILPSKGSAHNTCCFAQLSIPVTGLLGVASLSASATCEFQMLPLVHDTVQARMRNLPSGYRLSAKTAAPRVASLRARVWLQTYDEGFASAADLASRRDPPLLVPAPPQDTPLRAPPADPLQDALAYLPTELPRQPAIAPSYLGLYFQSAVVRADSAVLAAARTGSSTPLKVVLAYKQTSGAGSVEGFGLADGDSDSDGQVFFELLEGRLLVVDQGSRAPSCLELWLEWVDPATSRSRRRLAGLGSLEEEEHGYGYGVGGGVRDVLVRDVSTEQAVGSVRVLVCEGADEAAVRAMLDRGDAALPTGPTDPIDQAPSDGADDGVLLVDPSYSDEVSELERHATSADSIADVDSVGEGLRDSLISLDSLGESRWSALAPAQRSGGFPSTRILDVSIVNCIHADALAGCAEEESLGVHVEYSISGLDAATRRSVVDSRVLWWDAECAILNGRAEHRFVFESARQMAVFLDQRVSFVARAGESLEASRSIGRADMDPTVLADMFEMSNEVRLALPVLDADGARVAELVVSLVHHVEPGLLQSTEFQSRKSVELPVAPCDGAEGAHLHVLVDRVLHLRRDRADTSDVCLELTWLSGSDAMDHAVVRSVSASSGEDDAVVWGEVVRMPLPPSPSPSPKLFKDTQLLASLVSASPARHVVGTVLVDVCMLAYLPVVEGWYNVLDPEQSPIGQLKLSLCFVPSGGQSSLAPVASLVEAESSESVSATLDQLKEKLDNILSSLTDASSASCTLHDDYSRRDEEASDSVLIDNEQCDVAEDSPIEDSVSPEMGFESAHVLEADAYSSDFESATGSPLSGDGQSVASAGHASVVEATFGASSGDIDVACRDAVQSDESFVQSDRSFDGAADMADCPAPEPPNPCASQLVEASAEVIDVRSPPDAPLTSVSCTQLPSGGGPIVAAGAPSRSATEDLEEDFPVKVDSDSVASGSVDSSFDLHSSTSEVEPSEEGIDDAPPMAPATAFLPVALAEAMPEEVSEDAQSLEHFPAPLEEVVSEGAIEDSRQRDSDDSWQSSGAVHVAATYADASLDHADVQAGVEADEEESLAGGSVVAALESSSEGVDRIDAEGGLFEGESSFASVSLTDDASAYSVPEAVVAEPSSLLDEAVDQGAAGEASGGSVRVQGVRGVEVGVDTASLERSFDDDSSGDVCTMADAATQSEDVSAGSGVDAPPLHDVPLESTSTESVFERRPADVLGEGNRLDAEEKASLRPTDVTPLECTDPSQSTAVAVAADSCHSALQSLVQAKVDRIVAAQGSPESKPAQRKPSALSCTITPEFLEAELYRLLPQKAGYCSGSRRAQIDAEMDRVSRIMTRLPNKVAKE